MEKRSCHQRCPYSKYCYYERADRDDFPAECGHYYKIEDILMDSRYDPDMHERRYSGD